VRPLIGCLDALDLELDPVTLFEVMDAPVEGEQELQAVVDVAIYHIMI
jgi:hypothetical protein